MEEQENNELWVNELFSHNSELFFQFRGVAEYQNPISTFTLSHHGYIIAIGFFTGEFLACDTRNFHNKHEYTTHQGEVTALSFSRDTLHISSGDKNGFFQIHNVVKGNKEFEQKFNSPIKSIINNSYDVNIFLVLLSDCSLFIVNLLNQTCIPLNQRFSTIIWGNDSQNFIGGYQKDITFCQLDDEKTMIKNSEKITVFGGSKETISSIISNYKKDCLLILDSRCYGNYFPLELKCNVFTYSDSINRAKYSFASFSIDDKYILMVDKATSSKTFVAYSSVVDGIFISTPVHFFKGLKEPIRGIVAHPSLPIIFLRLKYEIYTWSYYNPVPLYNSVPERGLMKKNADFIEQENEFDLSDCEEEEEELKKQFKYKPLKLMRREPEGILNIFPDDYKYPNQIYFLPYLHHEISLEQT